jgi:hypothetical protein
MRDILSSPRATEIHRVRRAARVRLLILSSLLLVCVVGAAAYFSADRHLTINSVVVVGNRTISHDEIVDVVNRDMEGSYLRMFAKANGLIYPKSKIYNDLVSTFPRMSSLSITQQGLNTLKISIVERAGTYLYCGEAVPVSHSDIGENCYFVNIDGYIFDRAPYISGDIYFRYYAPLAQANVNPLGTQMIEKEDFHTLTQFIEGLSALGFASTQLSISPKGESNVYLSGASGYDARIMFNRDDNLPMILDNLTLAIHKPEFANQVKEKYASLQYIDLRFKNKVLYKFN